MKTIIILSILLLSCHKEADVQPINCWRCNGVTIFQTTQSAATVQSWEEVLCMTDYEIRRYEDRNFVIDNGGHFYRSVTCIKQ